MKKLVAVACAVVLAGCATGEKISSLSPGMTKDQVIAKLGKPEGVDSRGKVEVFNYTHKLTSGGGAGHAVYQTVFRDGRLVAWGPETPKQKGSSGQTARLMSTITAD